MVHHEGRYVFIHCCGMVDPLFDDLIEIGVNCFNPFRTEVMDLHTFKASPGATFDVHKASDEWLGVELTLQ